jgi:hypothetical protein
MLVSRSGLRIFDVDQALPSHFAEYYGVRGYQDMMRALVPSVQRERLEVLCPTELRPLSVSQALNDPQLPIAARHPASANVATIVG